MDSEEVLISMVDSEQNSYSSYPGAIEAGGPLVAALLHTLPDVVWVARWSTRRFGFISPSLSNMLGYTPEEALALPLSALLTQESRERLIRALAAAVEQFHQAPANPQTHVMEMAVIAKNGLAVPMETAFRLRLDGAEDGDILIVGSSRSMAERYRNEQNALYLSRHDALTGLYNRRFYEEELQRLDRDKTSLPVTLVLADVNGLKLTNDAFGHLAGDQLLQRVSSFLAEASNGRGVLARIGGDEFVLLLPRTDEQSTAALLEKLRMALAQDQGVPLSVSISFGAATKTAPEQDMRSLFIAAEHQMYTHKWKERTALREKTVAQIARALDSRSEALAEHGRRVAALCAELAAASGFGGFGATEVETARQAGLLHDIGKIGIAEELLASGGPLSDSGLSQYQRHAEIGYQILASSQAYADLAEAALCHHERLDGSGYPRGLKGEAIPRLAQIVALANAYDRLLHPIYGGVRLSPAEALDAIQQKTGSWYDPALVAALSEALAQQG
jgi:diguanylate cyclase (GGDEF)-like protein